MTRQVARTSGQTLSHTVSALLRAAPGEGGAATVRSGNETGLRIISVGREIDEDAVRRLALSRHRDAQLATFDRGVALSHPDVALLLPTGTTTPA